jgi:hypothetical protein
MSEDKDGLAKNEEKYRTDFEALKNLEDGKLTDWLKEPWNMHHYIDMFVESARAAPYLMGHIGGVYLPISVAAMAWFALT